MQDESFHYHVFVIRAWQESTRGSQIEWRYSLELTPSSERLGATTIRALLHELELLLLQVTGAQSEIDDCQATSTPGSTPASDDHITGVG